MANKPREGTKRQEDLLVGYQVAAKLWIYEGTQLVAKFNAMLLANSILIATVSLIQQSEVVEPTFKRYLPILGILICLLWFLIAKRGFENYIYWIYSLRELEERFMSSDIKTVSRGGKYADGDGVRLKIDGQNKDLRMSQAARLLRIEHIWYFVILVFIGVHVGLLVSYSP